MKISEHAQKSSIFDRWEISLFELKNKRGKKFKITRRIPSLSVSETKIFRSKKKAKEQLNKWLR